MESNEKPFNDVKVDETGELVGEHQRYSHTTGIMQQQGCCEYALVHVSDDLNSSTLAICCLMLCGCGVCYAASTPQLTTTRGASSRLLKFPNDSNGVQ